METKQLLKWQSPLEDLIVMPEFTKPIIDVVYFPTTQVAKILDRPPGKFNF